MDALNANPNQNQQTAEVQAAPAQAQAQAQAQPAQITPQQERAELDKYKADLLRVHAEVQAKAEMLNALRQKGITNKAGLEKHLAEAAEANTAQAEDNISLPTPNLSNPEAAEAEDYATLKKEVENLKQLTGNQALKLRTNDLRAEIDKATANNPQLAFTKKGINEAVLHDIIREQDRDAKDNQPKPLEHYLNKTETLFRDFYKKLGGQIPHELNQQTQTSTSAPNPNGQIQMPDAPTLPASAATTPTPDKPLGINPRGHFDPELAADQFLSQQGLKP